MADFKVIPTRPMVGVFDTLSSADEIGYGNWRVVKNATTRSTRNRQRGGGWRRAFADIVPYNNQDLHDQLTDRLSYYDTYFGHAMGGGGVSGYGYPYFVPAYTQDDFTIQPPANQMYCGVYIGDYPYYEYNGCDVFYPFIGFPHRLLPASPEICNTGAPDFYAHSFLYTSCQFFYDEVDFSGYFYGPPFAIYSSQFSYDFIYCGTTVNQMSGCREAVTMLNEIVTSTGRKLIAATMSRVYELNQSAGNWRILAAGLGNAGYSIAQCGCNETRGMSATMGGYLMFTNNFDQPTIYFVGDPSSGCGLDSLQIITDLDALNVTRAGGVVSWKGFSIFFDLTEDGNRYGGDVIWSDLENPNSYIESDTSFAGRATIAVGETILAAAPIGNWLIIYTDKSIIRATLVGGDDVFNFERIYNGGNALKYKFSLINCGDTHLYLGESDVYMFTQFDTRPISVNWITRAAGMIFNGIEEDDASYQPINKDACHMVTGGWSDEKREAWLSWATADNTCPDVTLRFNLKFNTADYVDHGFTSYLTFRPDNRPTIGQWIEDMGICLRGTQVATGLKDGPTCDAATNIVENPPLYIRNPEENPDLPVHPDSLCSRLAGKSIDDFCSDCAAPTRFLSASAEDFTIKQQEDEIYYRERLGSGDVPCETTNFHTAAGEADGFSGTLIELDEWFTVGSNCQSITAKLVESEPPVVDPPVTPPIALHCGAAGDMDFTDAIESGKTIDWNSRWKKIAYCESLQMVIADSDDDTGISLLKFWTATAQHDHTLPISGTFRTRGLFYDTVSDRIIALIRYGGDSPPWTYKIAILEPTTGIENEIDLTALITTTQLGSGVSPDEVEFEADFVNMNTSRIGVAMKAAHHVSGPAFNLVLKINLATVTIEDSFSQPRESLAGGGNSGRRLLGGAMYFCSGSSISIGATFHTPDGSLFARQILSFFPFGLTSGLTHELWDAQYVKSTGAIWFREETSGVYRQGSPVLTIDTFNVAASGRYNILIDKFIITDSGTNQVKFFSPSGLVVVSTVNLSSASSSWYIATSISNGKTYVHDNDAPYKIHEIDVI